MLTFHSLTLLQFTCVTPVTVLKYTERMSPWKLLVTTHLKQEPIPTFFIIIFYSLQSDVSAHDKNLPFMVLLVACNIIFSWSTVQCLFTGSGCGCPARNFLLRTVNWLRMMKPDAICNNYLQFSRFVTSCLSRVSTPAPQPKKKGLSCHCKTTSCRVRRTSCCVS